MILTSFHSWVALPQYVVLDANGADALSFLQGQLSNDLEALGTTRAGFAAYCAANGRMLASALVWQDSPDTVSLLVHRSLAEFLIKRLGMFVLRAKVTLSQREATVYGAYQATSSLTDNGTFEVLHPNQDTVLIQAPSSETVGRWWVISRATPTGTPDHSREAQQRWEAQSLQRGIAHIEQATQDLFIPQTLNMELIHAISFSKGCFPGQEVVARSHYRGTIRRRTALFSLCASDVDAAGLTPTSDLFGSGDEAQPVGRVINSAQLNERYYLLAEVVLEEWVGNQDYRLHHNQGPLLQREPLPYDITQQRDNKRPKL